MQRSNYRRERGAGSRAGVWEIMVNWAVSLDGAILLWLQEAVRSETLNPLISVYTRLGSGGALWVGLSLLMLCFKSTRRGGVTALGAMLLGLLCANILLKNLVARPRPWLDVPGLLPLVDTPDPNSFPSGHTCAAFACATAWWRALPRRWMRLTGLILAVCMGLSRLYVGVHYPSDVLGGAVVGTLCGLAAWRLLEKRTKSL